MNIRFGGRSRRGMPTTVAGKLGISVFFAIFGGIGFIVLCGFAFGFYSDLQTRSWQQTPAVIEVSEVEEDREEEDPYRFNVAYTYTFDGQEYTGDQYLLNEGRTDNHNEVTSRAEQLPVGTETTCYVNPSAPEEAVLAHKPLGETLIMLPFMLIPLLFMGIGLGGLYMTWRHKPTDAPDAAVSIGREPGDEKKKVRNSMLGLFTIFLLFGGIFPVMFFILPVYNIMQAKDWEPVDATILSSSVGEHRDSEGDRSYSIDIEFEYEVDGRTYRSTRYDFMGGSSSGRSGKQAVVDDHPEGATKTAYVDPDDATEAVLNRDFSSRVWIGAITFLFPLVGLGGLIGMTIAMRRGAFDAGGAPSRPLVDSGGVAELVAEPTPAEPRVDGPLTLENRESRKAGFFALLVFGVAWNGFVYGAMVPSIGVSFFSGIFMLIGVAVLMGAAYQGMRLLNPTVVMTLNPGHVPLGEAFEIEWHLQGNAGRVKQLTVTLEGQEEAKYRRGTNTHTDTNTFYEQVLAENMSLAEIARGRAEGYMPAGAVHSFEGGNNKIIWTLRCRGTIDLWPDLNQAFDVKVLPRELSHAGTAT